MMTALLPAFSQRGEIRITCALTLAPWRAFWEGFGGQKAMDRLPTHMQAPGESTPTPSLARACEDLLVSGRPIRTTDLTPPLRSREQVCFGCKERIHSLGIPIRVRLESFSWHG